MAVPFVTAESISVTFGCFRHQEVDSDRMGAITFMNIRNNVTWKCFCFVVRKLISNNYYRNLQNSM